METPTVDRFGVDVCAVNVRRGNTRISGYRTNSSSVTHPLSIALRLQHISSPVFADIRLKHVLFKGDTAKERVKSSCRLIRSNTQSQDSVFVLVHYSVWSWSH